MVKARNALEGKKAGAEQAAIRQHCTDAGVIGQPDKATLALKEF